jgi:hypothetical protein
MKKFKANFTGSMLFEANTKAELQDFLDTALLNEIAKRSIASSYSFTKVKKLRK